MVCGAISGMILVREQYEYNGCNGERKGAWEIKVVREIVRKSRLREGENCVGSHHQIYICYTSCVEN